MLEYGNSLSREVRNLRLGDMVLTTSSFGNASLQWTKVLTWGHVQHTGNYSFVEIETESGAVLHLSSDHLLFVSSDSQGNGARDVRASEVKVRELVTVVRGQAALLSRVIRILHREKVGFYSFFTYDGTVVVDHVLCSVFAAGRHSIKNRFWDLFRIYAHFFPEDGNLGPKVGWSLFSRVSRLLGDVTDYIEGKPVFAWSS